MAKEKELFPLLNRIPKDEQTDRAVREILDEEKAAREEKTSRLRAARLSRDADP